MPEANVNVPNTGTAPIETSAITLPDGSTAYRQRTDIGDGTDIPIIRRVLEELLIRVSTAGDIIPTPTGQSVRFDDQGNLTVSNGLSIYGGASIYRTIAQATTNAVSIKGSQGQVYGWYLYNAASTVRFIKLYNSSRSGPNVGVDVPILTLPLPAGAAANLWCSSGLGSFSQGIGLATTVGSSYTDTTAVTAGDLIINLFYA